ncbi:MAG: hypothetical protein EPN22_05060 [Nitrospirae bacterium]|nr:MAG: hypothetical protein EPN22_05060 [Nitrospirota bacterium]
MKEIITTVMIGLAYTVFIVIAINFFAGLFSRRTQRKLRIDAGEKIVDLFRAGDEIRRKKAMAAVSPEETQEQVACVNGQTPGPMTGPEPEDAEPPKITAKVSQTDQIAHVDRMA